MRQAVGTRARRRGPRWWPASRPDPRSGSWLDRPTRGSVSGSGLWSWAQRARTWAPRPRWTSAGISPIAEPSLWTRAPFRQTTLVPSSSGQHRVGVQVRTSTATLRAALLLTVRAGAHRLRGQASGPRRPAPRQASGAGRPGTRSARGGGSWPTALCRDGAARSRGRRPRRHDRRFSFHTGYYDHPRG